MSRKTVYLDRLAKNILTERISYVSQSVANLIDSELMGPACQYSLDQLMELAGLSVATAIETEYGKSGLDHPLRILSVCGPGNNGGDGLVAARHLSLFGHVVDVWYPKPCARLPHILTQLRDVFSSNSDKSMPCGVISTNPLDPPGTLESYNIIIDAIFGFNFHGEVREPFSSIITQLAKVCNPYCGYGRHVPKGNTHPVRLVSIDVPSGWEVDNTKCRSTAVKTPLETSSEAEQDHTLLPHMLISLTIPKKCAERCSAIHYLGGRFISTRIASSFSLQIPTYPNSAQCVHL